MTRIFTSLLFLSFTFASAQTKRCSTTEYMKHKFPDSKVLADKEKAMNERIRAFETNTTAGSTGAQLVIPTVVHVVYGTTTQNISNTRINDQITILNKDYRKLNADTTLIPNAFKPLAADFEIEFCLASYDPSGAPTTGIERYQSSHGAWSLSDPPKYSSNGGLDNWDPQHYLNIWVCELSGGILGFATFPDDLSSNPNEDGVVIDYRYFGLSGAINAPYNLGRTTTHELGHWFGLLHIWGDDGSSCSGSDNVSDTPNQASENYTCNTGVVTDACSPSAPGIMYQNYMDYTDDACMVMFTSGQKTRSYAAVNAYRSQLEFSTGCGGVGFNEVKIDNSLIAYPNPAQTEITVALKSKMLNHPNISIYDMTGRLILSQHSNEYIQQVTLNVSKLNSGSYIITMEDSDGIYFQQINIQ